ncbi:hypothetical protein [Mucilaginibacter jinjuensis]|uniref:Uncharacterized protein n=1 Tax=Mucilaginibacter jinjuensis TaxID=1176721 RepID=A0ABY7TED6_9SPHI|nr:hypothetical protein [Mucilaginibacter jinjuensis]WCT14410.1 hypothetical protein PQO05_10750 [Mucilaginibacter jinjuensis]
MPSSIPFDHPSLVLGNVIDPLILSTLKQIGGLQSKIDAAQDKLNSQIALRRSLNMTINEMLDMGINVSSLQEKVTELDDAIVTAATSYAGTRLANETQIQQLKEQLADIETDDGIESPLDFGASIIKDMPLASDSLKLDAQYFSYEGENPSGSMSAIENYIKEATNGLGNKASADVVKTTSTQIGQQQKNHDLSGTLIITSSCTHKNAVMLSPCVIDVDKAVMVWNKLFPDDLLSTSDEDKLTAAVKTDAADSTNHLSMLSGATYGSSFVGMVHILKQQPGSDISLTDLAGSLQERLTIGNWLEDASGGYGIDQSFMDDIKNVLNTQKIMAHVTIVVMGTITSIRSNQLQTGLKAVTDLNPAKITSGMSAILDATTSEKRTVSQSADSAKLGAKLLAMQNSIIQNVLTGLNKADQSVNKVMDINTMMTAFEDYLNEVRKGKSGVPISFYLKNITKQQLARLWLNKYYPEKNE